MKFMSLGMWLAYLLYRATCAPSGKNIVLVDCIFLGIRYPSWQLMVYCEQQMVGREKIGVKVYTQN